MLRRSPLLSALVVLALAACNASSVPVSPEPAAPPVATAAAAVSAAPVMSVAQAPREVPAGAHAAVSPAQAAEALAHAERCLGDPTCTEDGEALFRAADDAGAAGVSCFRFYYGIGITKDLLRARACFERQVSAGGTCRGSSPDLDRLYLAAMLADAQGGAADTARAAGLFTDCFADASVTGVLAEGPARSHPDPARAPLDFCADIGGTTLSMGSCSIVERQRLAADQVRIDRLLFPGLDADGRKLAVAAREAWSVFAAREGEVGGDDYRGGSLQSNASLRRENMLQKQRAEALGHFSTYTPTAGVDPQKAERDLDAAYHTACDVDAERRKVCAAARRAWTTYRDAEVALYVHAHGRASSATDVARDVKTTLTRRYQAELEDVIKP